MIKANTKTDRDILAHIRQFANQALIHYKMEGKPIPSFNFEDIDGKNYSNSNTKGKIVLFKCWFINCVACVKEFPYLNNLVADYKDRKDILFISLAMDKKIDLQKFLLKNHFSYATVANQENYMSEKLHVQVYPTHLLIDKKGNVVKVTSDARQMDIFLQRELAKN